MAVQSALALLVSALLFGGMTLFSFGFAAFLFGNLAAAEAGRLLRRAFPPFYLWVIATAALGALLHLNLDHRNLAVLALVALSTLPARQLLMPAINAFLRSPMSSSSSYSRPRSLSRGRVRSPK